MAITIMKCKEFWSQTRGRTCSPCHKVGSEPNLVARSARVFASSSHLMNLIARKALGRWQRQGATRTLEVQGGSDPEKEHGAIMCNMFQGRDARKIQMSHMFEFVPALIWMLYKSDHYYLLWCYKWGNHPSVSLPPWQRSPSAVKSRTSKCNMICLILH